MSSSPFVPMAIPLPTSSASSIAYKAREISSAVNTVSKFLAHEALTDGGAVQTLSQLNPTVIVLCGSAILHTAHETFKYVQECQEQADYRPRLHTLVIAGGIGHSTNLLYEAVAQHAVYGSAFRDTAETKTSSTQLKGVPEGVLLDQIRQRFYAPRSEGPVHTAGASTTEHHARSAVRVLIDDKSTNCGANAACARQVLEQAGVYLGRNSDAPSSRDPRQSSRASEQDTRQRNSNEVVAVVQDPTMSLRTLKCFEKTYHDALHGASSGGLRFVAVPTFTPLVREVTAATTSEGKMSLSFDTDMCPSVDVTGLWTIPRFLGLVLGEIPRLRDDENGYGPKGKGFIGHVDIPGEVEQAWTLLNHAVNEGVIGGAR